MGPEWIPVISLRLLLPLTIMRWPLFGGVVAFLADTLDVVMLDRLGVSDYGSYNAVDKALDTYYLALEAWTCLAWWHRPAKIAALLLFAHRLVGAALYELTGERALLLAFPNLFELFFLSYLLIRRLGRGAAVNSTFRVVALNLLLLGPKLVQEYALHVARYPIYAVIRELVLSPLRLVD
jgi:hypothetical protein